MKANPILLITLFCAAAFALTTTPTTSRANASAHALLSTTCDLVCTGATCADGADVTTAATRTVTAATTSVGVRSIAPRHRHRAILASANALHTSVHARHHGRRHGRTAVHATLTGATPYAATPLPFAPRPLHHPARNHAALPHVSAKPHRTDSRGGAPYALGNASLSVGLGAHATRTVFSMNDHVTDPASGWLKGRSPPRGDPLDAFVVVPSACPRRTDRLSCVRPARSASRPRLGSIPVSSFMTFRCPGAASAPGVSLCSPCGFTSERAPEGGPLGPFMPSWRLYT